MKCPCESECPSGCPCPSYNCQTALVVSTWSFLGTDGPAQIVNTNGDENVPLFDLGLKTEVDGSCSVVYENEFYILGGKQIYSQISKIQADEMV